MAFDLAGMIAQAELLSDHENLDTLVTQFTNRVLFDIQTRYHWAKCTFRTNPSHANITNVTGTNPDLHKFPVNYNYVNTAMHDVIAVLGMAHGVMDEGNAFVSYNKGHVRRTGLVGLYSRAHGQVWSAQASSISQVYALVNGSVGTIRDTYVNMVCWPPPTTTSRTAGAGGVAAMLVHGSLDPLEGPTDTNWIMQEYFDVVLHGVMRLLWLYLGNIAAYNASKSAFEAGINSIFNAEETSRASTPVLRPGLPDEDELE